MPFDVVLDPRGLLRACDVIDNQLPYATMRSLNELGTKFQGNERDVIRQGMIIRRPWVTQGVKIDGSDFATKDNLRTRVHIDDGRDFLNKFEGGGIRTPIGGHSLAVPIGARPSKQALIPKSMRPRAFEFKEVGGAALVAHSKHLHKHTRSGVLSGTVRVFEGNNRTILIQGPNGGVILQRFGARRGRVAHILGGQFHAAGVVIGQRDAGLRVLYNLRPSTNVRALLHFHETAFAAVSEWPAIFERWYVQAVSTAR
jgi:hypothetical protein